MAPVFSVRLLVTFHFFPVYFFYNYYQENYSVFLGRGGGGRRGKKGAQNILRDLKNSNDQRADYKIFNICYCRLWHISRSECLCCFQHIDFVTAICFHPRVSNC